jgi:hypothetical protein
MKTTWVAVAKDPIDQDLRSLQILLRPIHTASRDIDPEPIFPKRFCFLFYGYWFSLPEIGDFLRESYQIL